ncbi:MAG: thiamine pyrophosphate-dependent dehydrogenase E1 component subunit alpha [Spirochaetaceae bacterium]
MEGSSGKSDKKKPDLSKEQLQDMYMKMLLTRAFEEKVAYFFSRGMVHGTTHLYVGEEATAVGAIANLSDEDWITSTHRGHGHTIAKGLDVNRMMAELLGKQDGYCKGKGGSMHISDITMGHLGANGIVGGGIPIATGAGLTVKLKGEDKVVVCFFGDGAINEGTFHESLNLASAWKLPVIFICENNQYGMSTSTSKATNIDDLSVRAQAYGIPGKRVDGNDIFAVYETVKEAKEHVKKEGPYLIVAETYRYMGHSKSDANRYRTKEEINEWKQKDPIPRMRSRLEENKVFSSDDLDEMEAKAKQMIEDAVAFAQSSPDPDPSDLPKDVYA